MGESCEQRRRPNGCKVCSVWGRYQCRNGYLHNLGTGAQMKPEKMFLALMRSKGYTDEDFKMDKGRYVNSNMQTRWNYFLLGWEMRGTM
jgi:hypothetical protein